MIEPEPRVAIDSPKMSDGIRVPWRFSRSTSSNASSGTSKIGLVSLRARRHVAAGAIEKDVDLSTRRENLVARGAHLWLVEHVADGSQCVAALLPNLLRLCLGRVSAASEDDDASLGFSEGGCNAAANHPIPARDHRNAAGK